MSAKQQRCRYARLQGTFWRHDRTGALSLAAVGLHARAMSYCADQMTDGGVPRHLLAAFFGGAIDQEVVAELVSSGVWKESKGGYLIRDWEQHNITAEKWATKKAETLERVRKSREKKAREIATESVEPSSCNALQERYSEPCNASVTHPPLDEGRRTKDEDEDLVDQTTHVDDGASTGVCQTPKGPAGEVFEHWRSVMGKPRAACSPKRLRLIRQALKSHGLETAKAAIDGCAGSPFHMGENDRRQRYDSLELILRDAEHIERFAEMAGAGVSRGVPLPAGSYGETDELSLFADVTDEQLARAERGRRYG